MAIYESYTQNTSSEYDPNAPIVLRDEQRKAVAKAKTRFRGGTGRKFLWNAKMRFGKTLSALQLAKELDVRRTLIVTHRPVVDANFREDFEKIFRDDMASWSYASRSDNGGSGEITALEKELKEDPSKHYVFFASMQYLCRSDLVNSKPNADTNPLKHLILNNDWDLVVVDEAHEATTGDTQGAEVVKYLSGKKANVLHLSGTPFNLLDSFSDAEIYTWDYIQEQEKKEELKAKGVPDSENHYITLPKMNIFTYDLAKLNGSKEVGEGAQFTLSEFFRTWSGNPKKDKAKMPEGAKGRFVHEEAVKNFLDLLCSEEGGNNYPFSTEEYQENFKHTFWVVPGVAEAKALTDMLRNHDVFKDVFQIINVAGEGDEDEQRSNALDAVNNAIGDDPDQTATITISCGRLTTGVTVKPWTAVFYLKGSDNTSAATYMQTIFRVQSADVRNGKMKSECYVFDFAPDRSLRAVAETAKFYNLSAKERAVASQASESSDLKKLKQFLSFCPVISLDGGQMVAFDEHKLFTRLNSVYIDRIIRSGYTDNALFNKDAIMRMDPDALKVLDKLDPKERVNSKGKGDCDPNRNISNNGLNGKGNQGGTSEEVAPDDDPGDGSQSTTGLSQDERDERRRKREELEKRRSKLRDITIRIPLLIFGGKFNDEEDITLDNFTRKVDDPSWFEFMPKNIGKDDFNKLKKGINASMFVEAGKCIRKMTREADKMHVEERIAAIAKIHDWFNNPNKETVLTPWRVVNMHLSDCLGGYSFFNETFTGPNQVEIPAADGDGKLFDFADTIIPRFVSHGEVTAEVFGCSEERPVIPDKGKKPDDVVLGKNGELRPANVMELKILEINSKTGLYPLYATYSLYRNRLQDYIDAGLIEDAENLSVEEEQVVWDDVLQNNIYVISNTRMAEAITRRTLYGFRDVQYTHIKNEPIVERAKTETDELAKELRSNRFWNGGNVKDTMLKFTAVIGNPPYQETKVTNNKAEALYPLFYDLSEKLSSIYTLISPARFLFNAGLTPKAWNKKMLSDNHLRVVDYFADSQNVFPSVLINGGVAILYRDNNSDFGAIDTFVPDKTLYSLIAKFNHLGDKSLASIIYGGRSDLKFNDVFIKDYPETPVNILRLLQSEHPEITSLGPNEEYELKSSSFVRTPYAFLSEEPENPEKYYKILGIENGKRVFKWVLRKYMTPRFPDNNNVEGYKVLISNADGAAGQIGKPIPARIIGKPIVVNPGTSSFPTFMGIGNFNTEREAMNVSKYILTKFVRTLLGILKVTQHITPNTWKYVPLQNFSEGSDIHWDRSIDEIDDELFDKYKLSPEERDFIKRMIQPMN